MKSRQTDRKKGRQIDKNEQSGRERNRERETERDRDRDRDRQRQRDAKCSV